MKISIIDYGSGNIHSVVKAFERSAKESNISADIKIVQDAKSLKFSDRVVLPGVGTYPDCYKGLYKIQDMIYVLEDIILKKGYPFLGICVGMQLLSNYGIEKSFTNGLGWIPGEVVPIISNNPHLKIPHIGWNTLHIKYPHVLFQDIPTGEQGFHAYFVHSYHFKCKFDKFCLATTNYGSQITAVVLKDNIIGTQFHPEKSQYLGLKFIANFLKWSP